MNPVHEHISYLTKSSIKITSLHAPYFVSPWHLHPEYELVWITEGYGTRFVGNSVQAFKKNDLIFIGSNIPHVWLSDRIFYLAGSQLSCSAKVVQFPEKTLAGMASLPEFSPIKQVLEHSKRGIKVGHTGKRKITEKIKLMFEVSDFEKLMILFEIIHNVGKIEGNELLASSGYGKYAEFQLNSRIEKARQYIMQHYQDELSLEQLADHVHMNPSSFCRLFKKHTQKSTGQFIQEVRIGYACKLLMDHRLSISEAAYASGYNNLSNFNRQFKKIMHTTPTEFANRQHLL